MKRQITSAMLGVACLVGGVSTVPAKKKPVVERIEARIYPPPVNLPNGGVTVVIYEYSTDQELQDLAQAFAKRGKDGLGSALGKMKKGYMEVPGAGELPVELAESKSEGAIRRLTIVAERGQAVSATRSMQIDNLGQEYPFTCVQLEFDAEGNGKGEIVLYAKLGFNSAGQMTIERWNIKPFQLIDVRSSKQSSSPSRG
jgi:hypothetical protein